MRTTLALAALVAALALPACQSSPTAARADAELSATATPLDRASRDPIDAPAAVLVVHGLGCPLCAHNVDEQLKAIRGVRDVSVNLGNGNITVALADTGRPSPADLASAVDRSGFTLVNLFTP